MKQEESGVLLDDFEAPAAAFDLDDFAHDVTAGLGGTGDVAHGARVVERELQSLSSGQLLQADARSGPVQRALDTPEIEVLDGMWRFCVRHGEARSMRRILPSEPHSR